MYALVVVLLGLLALPLAVEAQQPGKVARVGMLCQVTCESPAIEAFRQALRQFGYVAGQNLAFERRWAEGELDRLPTLAAELVALKVDVIFVPGGTPAARAAKGATSTIPIVIGGTGDPVRSGLVASLARPGGNLTGLSLQSFELDPKRLELMKQAVPRASRAAWLVVPGLQPEPVAESFRKQHQAAARSLAVTLHRVEVRGPDDLPAAFSGMAKDRVDSLLVQNTGLLNAQAVRIAELALKHRLPAIAEPRAFAEAGGLLAYGPSYREMYQRAADYVARILKGARPADLPVEQATRFELVVNLKTAKALGLTIPPAVLARADHIIQ